MYSRNGIRKRKCCAFAVPTIDLRTVASFSLLFIGTTWKGIGISREDRESVFTLVAGSNYIARQSSCSCSSSVVAP